jgi:peptide/nickel transport system substrate-binding protein
MRYRYAINRIFHGQSKSWRLHQDTINSTASFWRQLIKQIDVVEPSTVRLHLTESNPDVLFELSSACEVQILSKKYVDKVGLDAAALKPVGIGPYQLVEWNKGEFMRYEAQDKHWRVVPQFQ